MIASDDLATRTIEPHEFLDFVARKLARRFIDGYATLTRRLNEMDVLPDRDGRFRVNDFFCYDDRWRMVLSSLVRESDAVLMDLRGFTCRNAGVSSRLANCSGSFRSRACCSWSTVRPIWRFSTRRLAEPRRWHRMLGQRRRHR